MNDPGVSIEVAANGWWVRLRVRGELDLISSPVLLDALMVCAVEGATHLAVDLSEVGFIDSSGIGGLVHAARRLAAMGCAFKLVGVPPAIERVLATAAVDRFLLVEGAAASDPPPAIAAGG